LEEVIKELELNNKVLNDFDSIMNLHLDKIEELKITSMTNNSKFYNIIGLCINLKKLIVEGDLKINTNNIISNVFNPSTIENIVFDGVRLPTLKIMSKFTNIKSITLNNIKYSSIKGFLNNVEKKNVETLILDNTDFCRAPISIVSDFSKIKYLEIRNCENCKFDNFDFLAKNRYLDKVILTPINLDFVDVQNFTKGKAIKIIDAKLGKTTKKTLINRFFMDEAGIKVLINSAKLKDLSDNLNFNRIDKMVLNLNKNADLSDYMKLLKRVKSEIIVSVKDLSYLSVEDALLLKEQLNVKKIKVVNLENDYAVDINDVYSIDEYIEIRKRIDTFIKAVIDGKDNELEKVVKVYKAILFSDKKEIIDNNNQKSKLNNIINNIYTDFNYAELFSNCLACLNINIKTIKGIDLEEKTRFWNQVKIYENWYNIDLFLDAKSFNNKKNCDKKPKYFLVNDKEFYKDHKLKSTNYEHCVFTIDKNIINKYFKDNKSNFSLFGILLKRIKQIFLFNNKKAEALPEPVSNIQVNVDIKEKTAPKVKKAAKEKVNTKENIDTKEYTKEELNLLSKIDDLD